MLSRFLPRLNRRSCAAIILGNAILSFGLYHVHAQSGISEGGVLGLMLLIRHWLHISPAYSGVVLDALCYFLGWRVLGKDFLWYSGIASLAFAVFYRVWELFPPLWPMLYAHPAAAAILGAVFVGVGAGISVRAGGATGGDDAIAMALHRITHIDIEWLYLLTDLSVLLLSLTYLPLRRVVWSLLTVTLSGQIIGRIQKLPGARKQQHTL